MKYPVISLFSGAMGLDLGLMKAGLDVRLSVDFDKDVGKTLTANNHNHLIGDLRELIQDDPSCEFLLKSANIDKNDLFAVTGGPPCQSFSVAGKRKGLNDPRGSLFKEFVTVVDRLRPRFFVMENVMGLLSSKVSEDEEQTAYDVIIDSFHALGYATVSGVLNAVNYGTPQFRERLIIIGSRDQENIFLPYPTHFEKHQDAAYRWQCLRDCLFDLQEDKQRYTQFSKERLAILRKVPEGSNWKSLSESDQKVALGNAFHSGGGKTGFYRRLNFSQPAPTLLTSPVQQSSMMGHPTQDRPLSVEEYARIQQFPDDWKIEGSLSAQYRQIGNAVPVGLGCAIGQALLSASENNYQIHNKRIKKNPIQHAFEKDTYIIRSI